MDVVASFELMLRSDQTYRLSALSRRKPRVSYVTGDRNLCSSDMDRANAASRKEATRTYFSAKGSSMKRLVKQNQLKWQLPTMSDVLDHWVPLILLLGGVPLALLFLIIGTVTAGDG